MKEKLHSFYNKNYKKILILPALLIVLSLVYLGFFYAQNKDIMYRDVSLTGGTTITVLSNASVSEVEKALSEDFSDVLVRAISDNTGKQTHLSIITSEPPEKIKPALESYFGFSLTNENSSTEFTGAGLSENFYQQLLTAILFAFLLMALVVFVIFGESKKIKAYSVILTLAAAHLTFPSIRLLNILIISLGVLAIIYGFYLSKKKDMLIMAIIALLFIALIFFPIYYFIIPIAIALLAMYSYFSVPSIAVILAAFADIVLTLAVINIVGMTVSSAGIIAFLMLIGYSVDTDILLTTRVLRRKTESINSSIFGAFKTGITMTLTAMIAVSVALILVYPFATVLNQIFVILLIGLGFDIFNTWITNASIIKWYVEARGR